MATKLNVYDLNRKKTAILQNAYNIVETQTLNKIYTLTFSLPATDEKAGFCLPFHYVRWGEKGELYRIIKSGISESDITTLNVSCEHVIATLCDDIMFGVEQYGGAEVATAEVINYLFSKQKTQNWRLKNCAFEMNYEYLWEQENILNALYSIPKEFATPYKWSFDTTVYPWLISLEPIDETIKPQYYIRAKRNLLGSSTQQNFADICTRIYPLGYGEGINQLNIRDVNGGVPYLQAPDHVIEQYGIKEKVLVERQFESAESLKAYAQTMLDNLQTPSMSRTFDVVDLYEITSADIDNAKVGNICKMTVDDTISYITKTVRTLDKAGDLQIELSSKSTNIAETIASLADRVRIESVYSQGATQLYQHSKDANATPTKGMIMSLYFPSEMRQINKVLMRLQLKKFRSYSQTTENGGSVTKTTAAGGGTGTTSTGLSSISGNITSGPSSIETTENGGLGSDVMTSKTPLEFNTGYIELDTDPAGGGSTGESSITFTSATNEAEIATDKASAGGSSGITSGPLTEGGVTKNNTDVYSGETGGSAPNGYTEWSGGHGHDTYATFYHKHYENGGITGDPMVPSGWGYNYSNDVWGRTVSNGEHSHNIQVNDHAHRMNHSHGFGHYHTMSASSGEHFHTIPKHKHNVEFYNVGWHAHSLANHTHHIGNHRHFVSVDGHSHSIDKSLFNHTHGMDHTHNIEVNSFGSHAHTFSIGAHEHGITIPAHKHQIQAGIFESGNPSSFDIYIHGNKVATVDATSYNDDITAWLLDSDNQVPRNQWIDVEIRPNDLAYVVCSVFVQGFVQSRGGGNY